MSTSARTRPEPLEDEIPTEQDGAQTEAPLPDAHGGAWLEDDLYPLGLADLELVTPADEDRVSTDEFAPARQRTKTT